LITDWLGRRFVKICYNSNSHVDREIRISGLTADGVGDDNYKNPWLWIYFKTYIIECYYTPDKNHGLLL